MQQRKMQPLVIRRRRQVRHLRIVGREEDRRPRPARSRSGRLVQPGNVRRPGHRPLAVDERSSTTRRLPRWRTVYRTPRPPASIRHQIVRVRPPADLHRPPEGTRCHVTRARPVGLVNFGRPSARIDPRSDGGHPDDVRRHEKASPMADAAIDPERTVAHSGIVLFTGASRRDLPVDQSGITL